LLKCLQLGGCKKEKQFPERRGYIVADFWHDVGKLRIPWPQVCPDSIRDTDLKTPYNQHNAIELEKKEVREIIDKLKQLSAGKAPNLNLKNIVSREELLIRMYVFINYTTRLKR